MVQSEQPNNPWDDFNLDTSRLDSITDRLPFPNGITVEDMTGDYLRDERAMYVITYEKEGAKAHVKLDLFSTPRPQDYLFRISWIPPERDFQTKRGFSQRDYGQIAWQEIPDTFQAPRKPSSDDLKNGTEMYIAYQGSSLVDDLKLSDPHERNTYDQMVRGADLTREFPTRIVFAVSSVKNFPAYFFQVDIGESNGMGVSLMHGYSDCVNDRFVHWLLKNHYYDTQRAQPQKSANPLSTSLKMIVSDDFNARFSA